MVSCGRPGLGLWGVGCLSPSGRRWQPVGRLGWARLLAPDSPAFPNLHFPPFPLPSHLHRQVCLCLSCTHMCRHQMSLPLSHYQPPTPSSYFRHFVSAPYPFVLMHWAVLLPLLLAPLCPLPPYVGAVASASHPPFHGLTFPLPPPSFCSARFPFHLLLVSHFHFSFAALLVPQPLMPAHSAKAASIRKRHI